MWESEVGKNLAIVEVPGKLLEEISVFESKGTGGLNET
jgi:hypothetical protein